MTRLLGLEEARGLASRWRGEGKRLVLANGCFDLLHVGHVRYLEEARAMGDALLVGINSDASVARLKGAGRPIMTAAERAEIVGALESVDAVVIFDEDTPHEIITALQPDILVKGADWAANAIVGRDVVEARGGRVVRIPVEDGYSTSSIVEKIRSVARTE